MPIENVDEIGLRLESLFGMPHDLLGGARRVQVITACTGLKVIQDPDQLQMSDFRRDAKWLRSREESLARMPAEQLYAGRQHILLMSGVAAARSRLQIDVKIVSAGYGLVDGSRELAPYDATFTGMSSKEIYEWGEELSLPETVSEALKTSDYDFTLLMLGGAYLKACQLPRVMNLTTPTFVLTGQSGQVRIPAGANVRPVRLGGSDTRLFRSGYVGLKGAVAGELLVSLGSYSERS